MMSSVSDDLVMMSLLLSVQRGVRGRQEHLGGEKQGKQRYSLSLSEAVMKLKFCLPHPIAKLSC